MLTIVMYHYVRDLPRTPFPRIKGLRTERFEGQLDYISQRYTVCRLADVIAAARGESTLPPNACVLTFDDGLLDHYQTVLPRLLDRGFTGAFFPPAQPLEEHCVLDVHKIQFVLAAAEDHSKLGHEVLRQADQFRNRFEIPSEDQLRASIDVESRFDSPETIFVKRLLQWVLPEPVRSAIAGNLFRKYVSHDEPAFAQELYMNIPQLREMCSAGMEIGGHGYKHRWLGKLPGEDQAQEIHRTIAFLTRIFDQKPVDWLMCYPFGSYNAQTLELVAGMGCAAGLTTKVGQASLSRLLELDRFDTNDLPVSAEAKTPTEVGAAK